MGKPIVNNETVGPILNDTKEEAARKKARRKAIKELERRAKKTKKIIEGLEKAQRVSSETLMIDLD